jgi:small subunit ribosomal protein S18
MERETEEIEAEAAEVQPAAAGEERGAEGEERRPSAERGPRQERGERGERGEGGERPRRRGRGRRRPCVMCVDKMTMVDYKDFNFLRRFISDRGRIETRRKTGTCAKHQRALAQAIKRARFLALLPYTAEHFRMGVTPSR